MAWATCSRCKYVQIPAESCLRCGAPLPARSSESHDEPAGAKPRWPQGALPGAAVVLGAAILLGLLLFRNAPDRAAPSPPPGDASSPPLDVSGKWKVRFSKNLASTPPRPALKEVSIESAADGSIFAARVELIDPGRGGAGAGYRIVPDGRRRLDAAIAAIAAAPSGAPIALDFIQPPPWVPDRKRLWRALEGESRDPSRIRYVVLESLEDDYLLQAGINETGFLSYAFFSPAYAKGRGVDALSRILHPESEGSLRGFRSLVWDLSGSADFLAMTVEATLSGPEGGPADRLTLTR